MALSDKKINSYLVTVTLLLLFCCSTFVSVSAHKHHHHPKSMHHHPISMHRKQHHPNYSLSFSLTSLPFNPPPSPLLSSLVSTRTSHAESYHYKSSFKYTMALIIALPIGTPPQTQHMVLDTGSQLSWIQCHNNNVVHTSASFYPSLSSSFSVLPCTHPLCKPTIPDFTLPTSCDQKRLCHYSYFYADGTLAEGSLVREKFTFSPSQLTPPLILGCAQQSRNANGILGMNLGRLSFTSQARIKLFSYCVPLRRNQGDLASPAGSFYIGRNPNSAGFQYVSLLSAAQHERSPNYDPLAYTVGLEGITIGGKRLNIPGRVFQADAGGSGQTIIDSGTEYTFLVDEAYDKVREEIVRLVGPKLKKGYVYGEALDMCFDSANAGEVQRMIGGMVLGFEKGVRIVVERERILGDVGGGVHCVGIGRSSILGVASNIIGNFHQQNLWVEFDVSNRRLGFGKADCSKSLL